MNDVEHKDFIGYYRNLYPTGYCEHLIKEFNRLEESGAGYNRQKGENANKHIKDDYQIFIDLRNHNLKNFENKDSCDLFFEGLQTCYEDYTEKYSILRDNGKIRATVMKMQRTSPGGGYHIWHGEQGPGPQASRVIVYMVYLNSFEDGDGGETEFLYQRTRVKPEENLMILWPAAYTHAHRGNPVLADKYKYIVTGWFYYD
jgi:hypothetical protein